MADATAAAIEGQAGDEGEVDRLGRDLPVGLAAEIRARFGDAEHARRQFIETADGNRIDLAAAA